MTHVLVAQMKQFTELSSEEVLAIEQSFPIRTFAKGFFLLEQGKVAKDAYFVVAGCVRKYYRSDGDELTVDFYTEEQSFADFESLSHQTPSNYCYVCTEETTLAVLNADKEAALYQKFPRFETICRVEFEKMMGVKVADSQRFGHLKPEERYVQLRKERPNLIQRVPQYQIASYLGLTPQSLSRIRKRLVR